MSGYCSIGRGEIKKKTRRFLKQGAGLLFLVEKFVVFVNVFYRRQLLGDQGLSLLRQ